MVLNYSAGLTQTPDSVEESALPGVRLALATCAGYAVGFNFGSANHCGLRKGVLIPEATRGQGKPFETSRWEATSPQLFGP
jgi:hypothetical protein